MQALGRPSTLGTAYTAAQVTAQINANTGTERWVFDRLDSSGRYLSDLTPLVDYDHPPEISHDSAAAVKRTFKITLRGDAVFTPLLELIRPHYQLLMPDGGYIDFPLGTFLILPPSKQIQKGLTWRQMNGADLGQLLVDGAFTTSYGVPSGTPVLQAINSIAQSYGGATPIGVDIPDPGIIIPANLSWPPGDTRLKAINDLLAAINYVEAWFDELGVMRSSPIPDYTTIVPSYTFDATSGAIVKAPLLETIDISKAYNQVSVLVEDPRRTPFAVLYQNNLPDSPVSVPNWHPKLKLIRDSRITGVLQAYLRAQTEAQKAARIFDIVTMETWPWALSQNLDVYTLTYQTQEDGLVSANYIETKWTHRCKHGLSTTHTIDRVVPA
jgi:hypothetical protein